MTAREGQGDQDGPAPDPAARALRQAQIAATAAAVVPTVLASQGMVALGHDVLRLPVVVALGIAVFLEIGLVASALLARASAVAGRPAGADAVAVWVLSAVSGILSSAHELLSGPDAFGHRSWQHDAPSVLAAGVRLVAPLVAAWLWERVLVSTRRQLAPRSLAEIRRDRRLLRLGAAALRVKRLEDPTQARAGRHPARVRRARRRLDRRHVALLRHASPTDPQLHRDIQTWLSRFGVVDHYPAMTGHRPPGAQIGPDVVAGPSQEHQEHQEHTSERRAAATDDPLPLPAAGREPVIAEPAEEPGTVEEIFASPPAARDRNAAAGSTLTARQAAVAEILRAAHPATISAPALARGLRARGFVMSDRTALRDLAVVKAHLGPTALTVVR